MKGFLQLTLPQVIQHNFDFLHSSSPEGDENN